MIGTMPSDGIPETVNPAEEMFGYERTIETVREASEGIGAEELVDRLMSRAREFAGEEPQQQGRESATMPATPL